MANVYIKGRSPKGTVGVDGVVDSGELSAYTAGVLSGFGGKSVSSWTIQVGGQTGVQDTAVAQNPSGESELFAGTPGQSIGFTLPGAPGTPGQSQVHALVIYKDPFTVSLVNNAVDVIDYQVVSGTAATTGSQVAPSEAAIRSAIPSGSLKFVVVVGYVTVAYGASSVSLGNLVVNRAVLNEVLRPLEAKRSPNLATDTTGALTYVRLSPTTDEVEIMVGASGKVLISYKCNTAVGATTYSCYVSYGLSGANTRTAAATETLGAHYNAIPPIANTYSDQCSVTFLETGLTPGLTKFSMYYKITAGGIAYFRDRNISAVAL